MKFKMNDRVRIKVGTKDPDVEGYVIGGMTGTILDFCSDYVGVEVDKEFIESMPNWVKETLEKSGQSLNPIYLEEKELEHISLLTPQPDPKNKGQVVYDRLAEWLDENDYSDRLKRLCYERYLQGLEKYGQPLMSNDGRDTESDVVQEMLDLLIYMRKGIIQGKDWNYHFFEFARLIDEFLEENI